MTGSFYPRLDNQQQTEISSITDIFHWCCGTTTDNEQYVLVTNEDMINNHLNKVQHLIEDDYVDLVTIVSSLQGYTQNVSGVLQKVHEGSFVNTITKHSK